MLNPGVVALVVEYAPTVVSWIKENLLPQHAPVTVAEIEKFPRQSHTPEGSAFIGLTGQSGGGKSSLINALLGMTYDETSDEEQPGMAQTGPTETTGVIHTDINSFDMPGVEGLLKLMDLPGAGTANFPIETYVKDMSLRWMHAIVIVLKDGRPAEVDAILAKSAAKLGIPTFLVANKFGISVRGAYDRNKGTYDEAKVNKVKKKVKDAVMQFLEENGCSTAVPPDHVFLLDSEQMTLFEGPAFSRRMLRLVTGNKLPKLFN